MILINRLTVVGSFHKGQVHNDWFWKMVTEIKPE